MRLRINIAISLVALIAICWGVRFAVAQERRRTPEFLQAKYQELNRTFFHNQLPPVQVDWADLTEENRVGKTYLKEDNSFVILVDRDTNVRDGELEDTVEHETCHVVTWRQEEDPHGRRFRACMSRIKANKH
jgi:predicted SprT family Zn-dependent metalloprotease